MLAGALAGRCPILTSASQLGTVERSEVTIAAAVKHTAPNGGKKTQKIDET